MVEIDDDDDDDDDDFDNFVDDAIFENDEKVLVVGNTTTICDNNAIYIKRKSLRNLYSNGLVSFKRLF